MYIDSVVVVCTQTTTGQNEVFVLVKHLRWEKVSCLESRPQFRGVLIVRGSTAYTCRKGGHLSWRRPGKVTRRSSKSCSALERTFSSPATRSVCFTECPSVHKCTCSDSCCSLVCQCAVSALLRFCVLYRVFYPLRCVVRE